jgi:F0F1-type ATP synthase assembly protein I
MQRRLNALMQRAVASSQRPPDDDVSMARDTSRRRPNERPASSVPGERGREPRLVNQPADQRHARLISGVSIAFIIVGGIIGALLGLLAGLFPGVSWWGGLIVGAIAGMVLGGIAPVRVALNRLEGEVRPPAETTTASPKVRTRDPYRRRR